jgi:hypothetical protein
MLILPTLIWANHVLIVIHMGMMQNSHSRSILNYNKTNFILLMLAKAKVIGKKGKGQPIRGQSPNQLKANPTPWRLGLHG